MQHPSCGSTCQAQERTCRHMDHTTWRPCVVRCHPSTHKRTSAPLLVRTLGDHVYTSPSTEVPNILCSHCGPVSACLPGPRQNYGTRSRVCSMELAHAAVQAEIVLLQDGMDCVLSTHKLNTPASDNCASQRLCIEQKECFSWFAELYNGQYVTDEAMVWADGEAEWLPLSACNELHSALVFQGACVRACVCLQGHRCASCTGAAARTCIVPDCVADADDRHVIAAMYCKRHSCWKAR
jgi:hypothetical protein